MKKILLAILGVVLVSGGAYAVSETLNSEPETYSWRYKMTVEIDTPEGVKSGSAVREVSVVITPTDNNERGYYSHSTMKGEAVVIDLGQKGMLFAVQNASDKNLPFDVFESPRGGLTREGAQYFSELSAKTDLPKKEYPMFVAFSDIEDPLSVKLIYGHNATGETGDNAYVFQDNFKTYFGEAFSLKNITLEMTNDNVTYPIRGIIPWLENYYNKRLDGNRFGRSDAKNRLANRLSSGAFSSGQGE